jgi:hypothetical protein
MLRAIFFIDSPALHVPLALNTCQGCVTVLMLEITSLACMGLPVTACITAQLLSMQPTIINTVYFII